MCMDKKEKAVSLFKNGYGCAQAVLLAFADELNIDENTAAKLASSFGDWPPLSAEAWAACAKCAGPSARCL